MAIRLGENNYGKQRVRILQIARHADRHDIKELTLGIRLEGDFEEAHTKGDNRKVLPTDTMKNTVYALAKLHSIKSPEEFGSSRPKNSASVWPIISWRAVRKSPACVSKRPKHSGHASPSMEKRTRTRSPVQAMRNAPPSLLPRVKKRLFKPASRAWSC